MKISRQSVSNVRTLPWPRPRRSCPSYRRPETPPVKRCSLSAARNASPLSNSSKSACTLLPFAAAAQPFPQKRPIPGKVIHNRNSYHRRAPFQTINKIINMIIAQNGSGGGPAAGFRAVCAAFVPTGLPKPFPPAILIARQAPTETSAKRKEGRDVSHCRADGAGNEGRRWKNRLPGSASERDAFPGLSPYQNQESFLALC